MLFPVVFVCFVAVGYGAKKAPPASEPVSDPFSDLVRNGIVDKHNEHRGAVTDENANAVVIPDIEWDTNLEAFADNAASQMAENCQMSHTSSDARKNIAGWEGTYVGENLAYSASTAYVDVDEQKLLEIAVKGVNGWNSERQWYHISSNTCDDGKVCGHYTQEVWDDSTKVGCAIKKCASASMPSYILACNYGPGGNMNGKRPYNREGCTPQDTVISTDPEGNTVETTVTCEGECTYTTVKTIYGNGGWSSRTSYQC